MADEVILEDRGVRITTTKALIGRTTYPVNGITSVGDAVERPTLTMPLVVGLGSLVFGGLGALELFVALLPPPPGQLVESATAMLIGGPLLMLLATICLGLAVRMWLTSAPRYFVVIGTAGGERRALGTPDREFAEQVRAAVEEAISRRG